MLAEAVRMRPGDEEVADLLVRCAPDAARLASSILRDPSAAEDALQQAAVLAWQARARIKSTDNLSAWFGKIVVNVCRDELRRRSKVRLLPFEQSEVTPTDRISARDELGRAIGRLTPDEQVVIGLRFGRDLSISQIAEHTGIPEGTAKSRLHNALEHLRASLAAERRLEESNDE